MSDDPRKHFLAPEWDGSGVPIEANMTTAELDAAYEKAMERVGDQTTALRTAFIAGWEAAGGDSVAAEAAFEKHYPFLSKGD